VKTARICEVRSITSNRGVIVIGWQDGNLVVGSGVRYRTYAAFNWTGCPSAWNKIGFGYDHNSNVTMGNFFYGYQTVRLPYWLIMLSLSILTVAAWRRARFKLITPM
jgi:hypothetical protein